MLKNKQKQIEINSDILISISMKLLDTYDITSSIQSILLLSYLTVKEFSRKQEHLDKHAKFDLCIQYTPDLIRALINAGLMTEDLAAGLLHVFKIQQEDVKNTLDAYYIMSDYKLKDGTSAPTNKCCLKLS